MAEGGTGGIKGTGKAARGGCVRDSGTDTPAPRWWTTTREDDSRRNESCEALKRERERERDDIDGARRSSRGE